VAVQSVDQCVTEEQGSGNWSWKLFCCMSGITERKYSARYTSTRSLESCST